MNSRLVVGMGVGLGLAATACGDDGRDYAPGSDGGLLDAAVDQFDGAVVQDAASTSSGGRTTSDVEGNTATIDVSLVTGLDGGTTSANAYDASDSQVTTTDDPRTQETDGGTETTELDAGTGSGSNSAASSSGSESIGDAGIILADSGQSSDAGSDSGADSGTSAPTLDGGDASDAEASTPVTVSVNATAMGDWVGYPIQLSAEAEASDGSEVTYSWQLRAAPEGSEINNGNIVESGTSAEFYPDRAGEYVLRVSATAGDVTNTADVSVEANAFDVGYVSFLGSEEVWTKAGFMVQSDGTNDRQVGCEVASSTGTEESWLGIFNIYDRLQVQPYLPNAVGLAGRIAYSYEVNEGSYETVVAGPEHRCGDNTPPQVLGAQFPLFAPGGERFSVYVQVSVVDGETTTTQTGIYTYNVDGSDPRAIRALTSSQDITAATWADDTTLVWIENAQVYRAQDVEGAADNELLREVILNCDGLENPIPDLQRAVERNNLLFVSNTGADDDIPEVWMLGQVGSGVYDCSQDAVSNLLLAGPNAHDFDISADGTLLLYNSRVDETDEAPGTSQLFLRNVNTPTESLLLSGESATIADGAHFAANGRQVVWTETQQQLVTQDEATYARPQQSRLMIANIDGSNKRVLAGTESTAEDVRFFHMGTNGSLCTVGSKLGSSGSNRMLALGLAGLATFLVGRRRSRKFSGME